MSYRVRRIGARDETHWRELWDGYNRFYEREPSEAVTAQTWRKIMDDSCPIHAIVAEDSIQGGVIGMANYVIHDSTSALQPACMMQDLFVDPKVRGAGTGKLLVPALLAHKRKQLSCARAL
jgi:GNAT superfamily N-acetyltransferase